MAKQGINITAGTEPLLEVRKLCTFFFTERGPLKAADGVDLILRKSEALGLVGESGCGKSTVARSIMRLVSSPGRVVSGQILITERDLLKLSEKQMRQIRGRMIAMVFQDPLTTLNPVLPVGYQIAEVLTTHRDRETTKSKSRGALKERVLELMRLVKIPAPRERFRQYPHELSGGMRQRAIIAAGLACNPLLLIADEPTTALDVTVQAQILDLLEEIKEKHGTSILLITHDLSTVNYLCDRIAVMYAGKIVEYGPNSRVFSDPHHPYTQALLECLPDLYRRKAIQPIPGEVPDLLCLPQGCSYQERCSQVMERCRLEEPQLHSIQSGWSVRCHLFLPEKNREK